MNNPQFYIFGVPDGFDMYNATPERLNLFQLLYDSDCRDRRKMAIYRNVDNTEVSYIYLRYNMQSVKGRPNSFLGMALTFTEGYYCNDIPKLLNLFEEIYSALSKDVILTTRIIPSAGQARYRIGRFAEGTAAIIKIEEFVEAQTRNWYGNCVVPMDDTFRLNTQSVSLKHGLYLDTKSEHIIANLKTASWVYLSESGRALEPNPPQPTTTYTSSNRPVTPPTKPVPTAQKAAVPPHKPQKQTPEVQPPSDPDITAEQERQRGVLSELQGEFNYLHKAISDRQSKGTLSEERDGLLVLQQKLNNLQYVVGTKEGNSLATQISSDINRIDELIRKRVAARKRWFALCGSAAVIVLLIVLWPKQTTSIDKESFSSFCYRTNAKVSEILNGLDAIDGSLKNTSEYTNVQALIDEIQKMTKSLKEQLSKDSLDSTMLKSLKSDTLRVNRKLEQLTNSFKSLSSLKKTEETRQSSTSTVGGSSGDRTNSGQSPTGTNVGLKIGGIIQDKKQSMGNVYKYEYEAKSNKITFELTNGHTASWDINGDIVAAHNDGSSFTIDANGNGKVTATINNFDIKLEINIKKK